MEELSERGSRRPLGGADEREGKVAAEGVVQEKVAAGGVVQKKVATAEIVGGDSIVEKQRVLLWGDRWR